jgi:hypothetical protein
MMTRRARHSQAKLAASLIAALAIAAIALGQWQVNNQVGQVNRRVGGELYGNNTNMGTVRYAAYTQTNVLPSEARYATWRSGALPSELAMNARAVGPLPPNGAISYIPSQSNLQKAMKLPESQLYNPAYNIGGKPLDAQLSIAPGYQQGTIRYANLPAPSRVTSAAIPPPIPASAQPLPSGQPLPAPQLSGAKLPSGQLPAPTASGGWTSLAHSGLNLGSVRYNSLSQP